MNKSSLRYRNRNVCPGALVCLGERQHTRNDQYIKLVSKFRKKNEHAAENLTGGFDVCKRLKNNREALIKKTKRQNNDNLTFLTLKRPKTLIYHFGENWSLLGL